MALPIDLDAAVEATDDVPDAADVYDPDEEIAVTDIFDGDFVEAHTDFETFDELVAASPSEASSADELELVADGEWDEFVRETTEFEDEQALVFAARDHWVAKKLGLS